MTQERPKFSPKFEGRRFDNHSIPVELLADLAAYRDLVKAVARDVYIKANPERKRVPRTFDLAFKLSLKAVSEGSAVAELINDVDVEDESNIFQFSDYFDRGKQLVDDTIRSVADGGGHIPKDFPMKLLPQFGKIGKNLRPGEVINFGFGSGKVANISDSVRRTLVLLSADEVESEIDIIGKITGMNHKPENTFDIELEDGGTVVGPYSQAFEEDIVIAYRKSSDLSIRIKGDGVYNKQNRLLRIKEADEIEVLDAIDVSLLKAVKRIDEMTKLPAGWCDGSGNPLSQVGAEWITEILKVLVEDNELPSPYIFPTPSDQVQFEWTIPQGTIDVRINPESKDYELFAYSNDFEVEGAAFLKTRDDINTLAVEISKVLSLFPAP